MEWIDSVCGRTRHTSMWIKWTEPNGCVVTNTLTACCHRILSVCSGLVVACVPLDQLHFFSLPCLCSVHHYVLQCRERKRDGATQQRACRAQVCEWNFHRYILVYCVVAIAVRTRCLFPFILHVHVSHRTQMASFLEPLNDHLGNGSYFLLLFYAHKRKMQSTCPSPCWW